MKKILLASLALLSVPAWANLHLAPPDFDSSYGRAVFVDFKTAQYDITYDVANEVTTVKTKITFENTKAGKAIFDLVPSPTSIKVDGQNSNQHLISVPGGVTKLRLFDQALTPGTHVLEVENQITTNVEYHPDFSAISSALWLRDLKDRMFLEQYFPSNFEFDQYQMTLNFKVIGVKVVKQEIYTNGKVTQTSPNSWSIVFPDYYTVSCPFFHTTPQGWMRRRDFEYQSITGRIIPITIYSPLWRRTNTMAYWAKQWMAELEADYGPWGHDGFVAYGTMSGTGGMEHSGAAATSIAALDHEMLHSYFAKGVMPANGNAGWIDESIAAWRDHGYPRNATPGFESSDMGGKSVYARNTDKRAYSLGANFMAYLDYRFQNIGGLKAFLRGYFAAYKHMVITTEHLKNNLEFFSGMNLDTEFNTLIWGKSSADVGMEVEANPFHPELTKEQLHDML